MYLRPFFRTLGLRPCMDFNHLPETYRVIRKQSLKSMTVLVNSYSCKLFIL